MAISTDASCVDTLLTEAKMGNLFGDGGSTNGLIGGLVLGSILNGRNLFGANGYVDGFGGRGNWGWNAEQNSDRAAIESAVSAALAQNNQANNNAMLLLKDIQDTGQDIVAAVNSNGQTNLIQQLQSQIGLTNTISHATSETNAQIGDLEDHVTDGVNTLSNQISQLALTTQMGQAGINQNISNTGFALAQAITNDGDKTRALIQNIETANLNRQITVAQNEISELRNERAVRGSGIEITQNVNQNQAQQQQQQQAILTNHLLTQLVGEIQKNTNSVVNLGSMVASPQTANNVRT